MVSGQRGKKVYELGDPDYGVSWGLFTTSSCRKGLCRRTFAYHITAQIWTAGPAIGLIHDIPTCQDLLSRIEREVEGILEGLSKTVVVKAKL